MKRSRVQSQEAPRRTIWRLMVSPDCAFHCPDALFELLAAQVAVVDALFGELALHHHLGGDAGVVGAGQPQRVVAEHAMPADGDVDLGVLQHVTDVQRRR